MMEPELMQQLSVDDPMQEPELNLDGLRISSIQVLLEPPPIPDETDDEGEDFYSPLDHFQNLVKLSMSSAQCQSLEAFPHLPLLRSLMLADNNLTSGFEALAEADLQSLVRLDLSGNMISDVSVLEPLDALGNLQHLLLAENKVTENENYRDTVFDILPQLITVDGLDRDGTLIDDADDDEDLSSGDEGVHYAEDNAVQGDYEGESLVEDAESEDIGSEDEIDEEEDEDVDSNSDSELEDQENRRPTYGGKTSGEPHHIDDDEEDDDELEDEEDEGPPPPLLVQEVGSGTDYDDEEDEDEEDDEDEEEDEDEGDDGPGLAYLMTDDIPDDNDDEFEPANEAEEESEIESSDEDEYGSRNAQAQSSTTGGNGNSSHTTNTNGYHLKRPRSPPPTTSGSGDFDHGAGFDVDTTNGFGMAPFDGPATFDDEGTHDSKRPRV